MEAAVTGTAHGQREARPAPAKAAAPELPFVPDDVLDQILANAVAQQALNAMLREAGIDETVDLLGREAQRKAVAAFVVKARRKLEGEAAGAPACNSEQDEAPAGEQPDSSEFPEVSDDLVLFILGETRLHDQLRDIMRRRKLAGEPGELPFETLRAVVAELMDHAGGVLQARAPEPCEPRAPWWAFWRRF